MKEINRKIITAITLLALPFGLHADPILPAFTLFGQVRDPFGQLLEPEEGAEVILFLDGVEVMRKETTAIFGDGSNYMLRVSMDGAAAFTERYREDAATPGQSFFIKVAYQGHDHPVLEFFTPDGTLNIGQPGGHLRLNLTLGLDEDRDGLPDQWEIQHIAAINGGDDIIDIYDVHGDDDFDGDGRSNRDEYLANTYAFISQDFMYLEIMDQRINGEGELMAELEFAVVSNKTYYIEHSTDLINWEQASLYLDLEKSEGGLYYYADNFDVVRVYADVLASECFYRLRVN